MKYVFAFFLVIAPVVYACAKDIKSLKVDVELSNLPDGIKFHLLRRGMYGGIDTLETTMSRNGMLILTTDQVINGELIYVGYEKIGVNGDKKPSRSVLFFVDSPTVLIKGNMADWPIVKIEGSKATEVYTKYHRIKAPILRKVDSVMALMRRENATDSSVLNQLLVKYRLFALDYFKKNLNILSTPYMVQKSYPLTEADRKQLFEEMDKVTKESFFGKELEKKLSAGDKPANALAATVKVGNVLPDFKMTTESGSTVSFRELASRGEYTLIDFWAYWCVPCRAAIPKIKTVYEKYKDKGLNVIAVSTDPNVEKWKRALSELDTKWTNVIDHERLSIPVFSIDAIPSYILVDKDARIIAMDVFGNKNNGLSPIYFPSENELNLNGETIGQIMEILIKKE